MLAVQARLLLFFQVGVLLEALERTDELGLQLVVLIFHFMVLVSYVFDFLLVLHVFLHELEGLELAAERLLPDLVEHLCHSLQLTTPLRQLGSQLFYLEFLGDQ